MEADSGSLSAAAADTPGASESMGGEAPGAATPPKTCRLARARRGELAGFRELIHAYQDAVYTLALRMLRVPEDAEELAQDVFVSAHRHIGGISSEAHLLFWLRRTVCHRAIDRLRRRLPYPSVTLDDAPDLAGPDTAADPLLERQLRDMVQRLPPAARVVVLLRYQEDLDPPEISRTLDMPLNTVKSHLKRSLALLRRRCDELGLSTSAGGPS